MPMRRSAIKRKNLILQPDAKKVKVYEEIDRRFQAGEGVTLREHRSGFPAVTVDCGEVHILTDILSLEDWWREKKGLTIWDKPKREKGT